MNTPATPILPEPSAIEAHLSRFVQGQARAKRDLAVAVYQHFFGQAYRASTGRGLGSCHVLVIGPTGTGKTYMVRLLAEFLGVPFGFASATDLVEAGYRGKPIESVLQALVASAGGDKKKAERGIVFVDEIDKIRRMDTGGTRDVSGEGVQNGFLALMDGGDKSIVDTSKLLFICSGAFVGLDELVRQRIGTRRSEIGFRVREGEDEQAARDVEKSTYAALCRVETRDLVRFGMIPEFVGRFSTVTVLHELSRQDLLGIMERSEDSAIARQQALARAHGIELRFDRDALDAIAAEAAAMGTGARGVKRLIDKALDGVDYRWPNLADEGVCRVTITRACVVAGTEPVFERGPAVAERIDRALREQAFAGTVRPPAATIPPPAHPGISDTSGWSAERIWNEVEAIKQGPMALPAAMPAAREWWGRFEDTNRDRPGLVFRLAEELRNREATLNELFVAFSQAGTDNIQATLHFLDYLRLKAPR